MPTWTPPHPRTSAAPPASPFSDNVPVSSGAVDYCPRTEAGYEKARVKLRAEFAAWCTSTGAEVDPDAGEGLLHYKWGFLDGHLTRWTCADLDAVLLEIYPAKMIVEGDDLERLLPEARVFMQFLGDTGLLDSASDDPKVLCSHLDSLGPRLRRNMADTSRYSWGKRFWLAAAAAGVRPDDQAAVEAYIDSFNSLPLPEREAMLGPTPSATTPEGLGPSRFTPPHQPPRRTRRQRRHR